MYTVVQLIALSQGVDLVPLSSLPIMVSAVGRRPATGFLVGLLVGPLQILLGPTQLASELASLVFIGMAAGGVIGWLVGSAGAVFTRLSEEAEAADQARHRADEIQHVSRTLYDGLPVGLYRSVESGKILDANPAFARMFGYNREEILHINAADVYADPTERAFRLRGL